MHGAQAPRTRTPASWWLPALSPAERGHAAHDKPAWVEFVEEALDRAPAAGAEAEEHLHSVPGGGAQSRLIHPLWPFLVAADARIDAAPHGVDERVLWAGARMWLGGRLVRLAARTLVSELRTAGLAGTLSSGDTHQRFDEFMRRLAARPALADVLRRYPVLARLLAEHCLGTLAAATELLDRFHADRPRFTARILGADPGRLASARFGLGDPHGGGRTVVILEFENERRLVYKPRPLGLHARWNELLGWFAGHQPELAPRAVRVLPASGYGWAEFLPTRPCDSIEDVSRFYRRLGAQLALLYAVDATDIHGENLIACGDQPVVVDVETLFHPYWVPSTDGGDDPAARALATSVQRTMVLPHMVLGRHGALDVSAVGARAGAHFPDDLPVWEEPGTDAMRLVRRRLPYPAGENRPVFAGTPADPAEYSASLLSGFRAAYRTITAHTAELIGPSGVLSRFAGERIRLVVRPSQTYAELLAEATEPASLRDRAARKQAFAALSDQAGHRHLRVLAAEELSELMSGDIPTFAARTDARDVWTTRGRKLPGLLDDRGLFLVHEHIHRMGAADLRQQEWLIEAALATLRPAPRHTAQPSGGDPACSKLPDQQHLLALAAGVGDEIVTRSFGNADRANWLGLGLLDGQSWAVMPMGAGLAEGYCGTALFLAELGRLSGVDRYTDLADKAVRSLPTLITLLAENPALSAAVGPGGFFGLGGVCYATARLANLLDSRELAAAVPTALAALAGALASPTVPADVADGTAGALLAAKAVHAETGLPEAADLTEELARRVATQIRPNEPGFLWGRDGVTQSLGERTHTEAEMPSDLAWCSGLAGTTLGSRVNIRYLTAAAHRPPMPDHSLCHGELGALEPLVILREAGDQWAAEVLRSACTRLLGSLDRHGIHCGTPGGVSTPGLLTGLAGIGYGLLRLGFAHVTPSVLLLQPAVRTGLDERREGRDGQHSGQGAGRRR